MAETARQVADAFEFLIAESRLPPGALIVLGCSTSEIGGAHIGRFGSPALGQDVIKGALSACAAHGTDLAVQCCEHLNRALVLTEEAAARRGYPAVSAVPHSRAGGSCAEAAYRAFEDPVLVEAIQADAGIDIGDTLIGMHIRPVAVPVRPPVSQIGEAHVTMAFSRPKYIGGPRARYTIENDK